MTSKPRYQIVLEPTPDCREPIPALRRLLKASLRSYGLRCKSAVEVKPSEDKRDVMAGKAARRADKLERRKLKRLNKTIHTAALDVGTAEQRNIPNQTSATSRSDGRDKSKE